MALSCANLLKTKRMTYRLFLLLITSLLFACSQKKENNSLPYFISSDLTPQWIENSDYAIHTIQSFELTDQNGRTFTRSNMTNKIVIADFFFTTCPGICPKMTSNLSRLQEEYKNDPNVLLLSHTVYPEVDSVETLAEYAEINNIEYNKWKLLTGTKKNLYKLAYKSYFADSDSSMQDLDDRFLHTENFFLIDTKGHIRGVYNGSLALEMNRIKDDVSQLKKDSE